MLKIFGGLERILFGKKSKPISDCFKWDWHLRETRGWKHSLTFAKALYELGANEYFDILAIHPTLPCFANVSGMVESLARNLPIRKLMVDNGDSIKNMDY